MIDCDTALSVGQSRARELDYCTISVNIYHMPLQVSWRPAVIIVSYHTQRAARVTICTVTAQPAAQPSQLFRLWQPVIKHRSGIRSTLWLYSSRRMEVATHMLHK